MELKEFVAQTLVEIQQGVQAAILRTTELKTNGAINPVWGTSRNADQTHVKQVTFDIAVTVSDKTAGNLTGGIKVIGVAVGKDSAKTEERSHVSRIQFSIPILHPITELHST